MVTSMFRHFDKLSDRKVYGSVTETECCNRKKLVAEASVAELVEASKRTSLISFYFLTENAQIIASLNVSPGRSTVVG